MESVRLIYIRADGNEEIAAGHIMRCLTIARELKKMGHCICFLVADEESAAILSENETDIIPVTLDSPYAGGTIGFFQLQTADYRKLDAEIDEISELLQMHPGTVLVDSYFITEKYLRHLQSLTKVAYMDDIRAFDYPVDLLINYDCFTPSMKTECEKTIYSNASSCLLGAEYAPLRPQFMDAKITIDENVKDVLLTTGSSDPYHFALHFCEKIVKTKKPNSENSTVPITYHIVVGSLNSDYEALLTLASKYPNIQLHRGLTDLMPLMRTCDLAITAGGTTLYELCALGIPTASFTMADNQLSNTQILNELEIVPYVGDVRTNIDKVISGCQQFIAEYSSDFAKRKAVHTKMNSLISGDGAFKIANAILNL